MKKCEVTKGETPNEFFERNGMSTATGRWVNEKTNQAAMSAVTAVGTDSVKIDCFKPWVGLQSCGDDEPLTWSGNSKKWLRGRLFWEMTRPLRPEVANSGFEWKDFIMCVCHEPMRDVEWHLYCLFGYTRTHTVAEINEWLRARDQSLRIKSEKNKVLKPVLNEGDQAAGWFEPDPLEPSKQLWESAVDYFDEGRDDTKDVWHAYIALNEIMQDPYPTPEARKQFAPRSFDYFLYYTTRYSLKDIGHYLHTIFAHGTAMMEEHCSLALHKNEGTECVHSEEKSQQQNHGRHQGCGTDMTEECAVYGSRKLCRHVRDGTGLVPHRQVTNGQQLVPVLSFLPQTSPTVA